MVYQVFFFFFIKQEHWLDMSYTLKSIERLVCITGSIVKCFLSNRTRPFSGCGDHVFIFHSSSISFSQRSHPLLSVCISSLSSLYTQHIDYVCTAQLYDGWSFIVHKTFQELHSRAALQRSPKQQRWMGTGYKTLKNKQQEKNTCNGFIQLVWCSLSLQSPKIPNWFALVASVGCRMVFSCYTWRTVGSFFICVH